MGPGTCWRGVAGTVVRCRRASPVAGTAPATSWPVVGLVAMASSTVLVAGTAPAMCWPGVAGRAPDADPWTSRPVGPGRARWTRRRQPCRRWCRAGRARSRRRVEPHEGEALAVPTGRSAGRASRPWRRARRTANRRSRGRVVRLDPIVRASPVSRHRRPDRVRVEPRRRAVRRDRPRGRECGARRRKRAGRGRVAGRRYLVARSPKWAWPVRRRYPE
jgi:hypothetical protein